MKFLFLGLIYFSFVSSASALSKPLAGYVVCLDPGHPSETSAGTESLDQKLSERHVNWVVALDLKSLLLNQGAKVVLTKSYEKEMVTNRHRAEIANSVHANLFLRLHCDAATDSGITTYYPDRQGHVDRHFGPSWKVIKTSHRDALVFQLATALYLRGDLNNLGVKGDSATRIGAKQGALTGSIFSDVPALTVEMVVLTNRHDYLFIRTQSGQQKMAQALLSGIDAVANIRLKNPD